MLEAGQLAAVQLYRQRRFASPSYCNDLGNENGLHRRNGRHQTRAFHLSHTGTLVYLPGGENVLVVCGNRRFKLDGVGRTAKFISDAFTNLKTDVRHPIRKGS